VVEELLRSDLEDPLLPRQLDVTTLIADMEGYTSQVESLPVEEAARLTRDFLDCLTGPVIEPGHARQIHRRRPGGLLGRAAAARTSMPTWRWTPRARSSPGARTERAREARRPSAAAGPDRHRERAGHGRRLSAPASAASIRRSATA
jgi:hypothetical protein